MIIPLNKGREAIIDDADAELIQRHTWWTHQSKKSRLGNAYAFTTIRRQCVFMHRLILAAPKGVQVDHANRNGLDNRRVNLRLCSQSLNNVNRATRAGSGYRGVYRTRSGKFRAELTAFRVEYCLGTYVSPEDAAKAYDAAAFDKFGDFAVLNFPGAAR